MPLVENLLAPSQVLAMVTILQTHLGLKLHLGLGSLFLHQGQIGLPATTQPDGSSSMSVSD